MGEDRGEQPHTSPGSTQLLAGLLEVDAEPEIVLDLDEQVGEADRATAGVQPAVELGEAVRLRRVALLGRVRLQSPPVVVERDLPVVSDTFQEPAERIRQARFQRLDRRVGVDGEPLPPRVGQKNASNRPTFFAPSMADERLQRRRDAVQRRIGRDAAAPRDAVFAVGLASPTASVTLPCPARRRTSSCSETARRTGSARRARRSARSGPSGRPASSSPGRLGPRAAEPPARLTAAGPAKLVVADVGIERLCADALVAAEHQIATRIAERIPPGLSAGQDRVVCGRGRNTTLSVFAVPDGRRPTSGIPRSG